MFDVITIGAAVRDVFLISDEFKILKSPKSKTGAYECVTLGSKIEIDKMVLTTGGGATNAAATFSSLGYHTACIGKIGNDSTGRGLIDELKDHKINTSMIKKVAGQTAYSSLLTTPTGERTILVHRGVSAKLTPSDIPWNKLKSKWIYLTSLGGNLALAKRIVQHAHEKNIQVAYNPGMSEIKKGRKAFAALLPMLSVLMVNREEAAALTGRPVKDLKGMIKDLTKHNLILIITDGEAGSYTSLGEDSWFAKPTKTKVISRTGAGDAFGSGFLSSLMKHDDLSRALQTGTLNAESVIGSIGAKRGILKRLPGAKELSKIKVSKF